LQQARDGIAAGWALGTPLDVADAKWALAFTLTRVGAFEEANNHLGEAMAAYAEAGWKRGQISGLVLQGQTWAGLSRHTLSVECFEQALDAACETHTVQAIVRSQMGLGKAAAAAGKWHRAERLCVEARARARRAGLGAAWVEAQVALAGVYLAQERWEPARMQAAQALASGQAMGFLDLVLAATDVLGRAWTGLGEMGRARACTQEANDVARRLSAPLSPTHASCFSRRRGRFEV
jgi:tetratricopeptide (TPR) repeat protein